MQTPILTKISRLLILVLVFLTPVFFLPLNTIALEPLKMFSILAVIVLMGIFILTKKIKANSFSFTKNILALSSFFVLLVSLLSAIFSTNTIISLIGRQINFSSFMSLFLLFTFSYVVVYMFSEIKEKTQLFLAVYISTLITILIHLVNILIPAIPNFGFFVSNTANTVGRWYDLGIIGLFGLLSSVLVLQYLKHLKFYKIIGVIGMIFSLALILMINSFFIWILVGVFSLFFIVLNIVMQQNSEITDRLSYPAFFVLIISIILILLGGKVGVLLNQTLAFQFEEVRPTLVATYQVSKDTLFQKPVLGYGINRFEVSWLLNRPEGVNLSNYWDTDFRYGYSNLSSVMVTQGIMGLLAWFLFIVSSVYVALKLLFLTIATKRDIFVNIFSVFGYLLFLVVTLIYVPSTSIILLLFLFLGLLIANANTAGIFVYKEILLDQNPRSALVYLFGLVLVLVFFIYSGYVLVTQYSSRIIFDEARKEYSTTGDLQKLEERILLSQFIFSSDVYMRALTNVGLTSISQLVQNQTLTQEQAQDRFRVILESTVRYAQLAIAYDEQSYVNKLALASIYKNLVQFNVNGAKDEALLILDQAADLSPNNPTVELEKARIYASAEEYDLAKAQILKTLEIKPNFADAAFLLSQIQVTLGEVDGAIQSMRSAISVQPQNPNLYFQLGLLKYNQNQYTDAIGAFESAVTLSPYFGNAKYFLGLSYYSNNRVEDAIAQFNDLSSLYPDNQEVVLILSNLKSGKQPFDGAQPPFDQRPETRDELPVDSDEAEAIASDTEEDTAE